MSDPPRPDLPGPMRRRGPRPLMLHLASRPSATLSPATMPTATLSPALAPPGLPMPPFGLTPPDPALVAGIAAYRRHPWRRCLDEPPVIWREGSARLLDYGAANPNAPAVLVAPSLINRGHVLDLMADRSMLRTLAARGRRPLLLDWGWPEPADRRLGVTGHVDRLLRARAAIPGPAALVGYCMGGLLALAACALNPHAFTGLAALATPWDFHAADRDAALRLAATLPALEPLMALTGALPVDILQLLFASVDDGTGIAAKYRRFGQSLQDGVAADRFVALEDWVNDGLPLAAPVVRECLADWYGRNLPGTGAWRIRSEAIRPETLRLPVLVAVPAHDRIVPPASARALATSIRGVTLLTPSLGHVGMVMGSRAESAVWRPLLDWLSALPSPI